MDFMRVASGHVMDIIGRMGRKRMKPKSDRHRQEAFTLRLPMWVLEALDSLGQKNMSNRTTEIRSAIRDYLQRNGQWRQD